ncbi:hypothetical protein AB9F45_38650, partial [Rhizobium leguminosarum]
RLVGSQRIVPGRAAKPWFNIWVNGGGGVSNGLQQLTMDTLWYIDPEQGLGGANWDNSLAADKPQYNADFNEMTVKLRKG